MSVRPNHETILVEAIAEGDQTAFLELFNLYFSIAGGVVFGAAGSLALAERAVQDTFVMIWLGREALAEIDNFEEYLVVLCCNRAGERLKKESMEKEFQMELQEKNNFSAHFRKEIIMGLKMLPFALQQVYQLIRIDGLSVPQASALLGRSERVVRAHLSEAVKELRLNLSVHIDPVIVVVLTSALELQQ